MIRFSKTTNTGQQTPSCPALVVFNQGLVCAFLANDSSNNLYTMFSQDGQNWSLLSHPGNNSTSAPPSLAVFNNTLYCAFKANDSSNNLYLISSSDGVTWSPTSHPGNNSTSQGPSLFVFSNKLYCAFRANDSSGNLYLISSDDGVNWSSTSNPGNNSTSATASFCVFNNKLYCAFRANDSSGNLYLISSDDGVTWSSTSHPGNNSTSNSPSLAVFENELYCAFKANDSSNNLYLISSSDGVTWSSTSNPGNNSTLSGPTLAASLGTELKCLFQSNDSSNRILQFNALKADWMSQNLPTIGVKKLSQICIPGSHDSGMSSSHNGTKGAKSCNTITQSLTVLGQLQNGARYFDIRPTIKSRQYYTGHYSDTGTILGWQGANGQSIDDIITEINEFTNANNELVILKVSKDLQTDSYRGFNQDEWDTLFSKLSKIKYLYTNKGTNNITEIKINEFINPGGTPNPSVLIIVEPREPNISLGRYKGIGFFSSSTFPLFDQYSDKNDPALMINDQIKKMKKNCSNYFLLSWTLTQSGKQAKDCALSNILPSFVWWVTKLFYNEDTTSILELAGIANSKLFNNKDLMDAVSSSCFPNIIYIDDINSEIGLVEMVMKMNQL